MALDIPANLSAVRSLEKESSSGATADPTREALTRVSSTELDTWTTMQSKGHERKIGAMKVNSI